VAQLPVDELAVRHAAMSYVADCAQRGGGVVTRHQLAAFAYRGDSMPLLDRGRGIRNPRQLQATLSILSTPGSRYNDGVSGNRLRYAFRADVRGRADNTKLLRAAELRVPVILFEQVATGVFSPVFPVYVVDDDPADDYVEVDTAPAAEATLETGDLRRYASHTVQQRLHQRAFRAAVTRAYGGACAVCELAHPGVLVAAHIDEDSAGGQPLVSNGIAMCTLHHAAFDNNLIGIRPDYVIEVRRSILDSTSDNAMLRAAFREIHGAPLHLPRRVNDRPDAFLLAARYERFRLSA
jgi:putative restriction endonuclease